MKMNINPQAKETVKDNTMALRWLSNTDKLGRNVHCLTGESQEQADAKYWRWRNRMIEGDPEGSDELSADELAARGMIGLYEQITIEVLNRLLGNAQSTLKKWRTIGKPFHEADNDLWKEYYRMDRNAWNELYKAIDAIEKPIGLIDGNGERLTIGTNGLLTADRMLMYSPDIEAKYTMNGIALPSAEKFVD
jgi:hypothetical protein